MVVEYEDGADLSRSRRRPGGFSPLTRDGDRKLGQVILEEPDWDELRRIEGGPRSADDINPRASAAGLTPGGQLVVDVCTPLIYAAVDALGRRAERWCYERACPTIKSAVVSTWIRLTKPRKIRWPGPDTEVVTLVNAAPESASTVVDAPVEGNIRMCRDAAQQRLRAARLAGVFSDEHVRLVRNARIEDGDRSMGLQSAQEQSAPEEVEGNVKELHDAQPSPLDEVGTYPGPNGSSPARARCYAAGMSRRRLSRSPARGGEVLRGLAHRDDCSHFNGPVHRTSGAVLLTPSLRDELASDALCVDCARREDLQSVAS
jgi:hypothetical protein